MICHPAGLHIWRYFLELNRTRGKHTTVIATAAGSQVIQEPSPITYQEIAGWQEVSKRALNQFERECLAYTDTVWLQATISKKSRSKKGQSIGEYCRGKDLEECKLAFGDALATICSTCPS